MTTPLPDTPSLPRIPLVRSAPGLTGPSPLGGCSTRRGFGAALARADADAAAAELERSALRAELARALAVHPRRLAWAHQVHGAQLRSVEQPGPQGPADALISLDPAHVLLVSVADCCPVLAWDPGAPPFGIAHAGWRGVVAGVLDALAKALRANGAVLGRARAWIGPAIGPCCFEVSADVAARFDPRCVVASDTPDKPHVDLRVACTLQLIAAGFDPAHIQVCGDCTSCRSDLYFSYRRDRGVCGRHLAYLTGAPPTPSAPRG